MRQKIIVVSDRVLCNCCLVSKLDQIRANGQRTRAEKNRAAVAPYSKGGTHEVATRVPKQRNPDIVKDIGPSRRLAPGPQRPQREMLGPTNSCVGGAAVARQSHKLKVEGSSPSPATKSKRGRPKVEGPRPWDVAGISRAEWYRRQAEKREGK